MNSTYCIKSKGGKYSTFNVYWTLQQSYYCCGIAEVGSISLVKRPENAFDPITEARKKAAISETKAKQVLSDALVKSVGNYRTLFLTDKVGGDSEQLMKMFKHPEWKKKITYSEQPNANTGHHLVTCLLLKKAQKKV